jgi:site-specific DNA recombinase
MEQKARTNGGILGFNIPYGYNYINGNLIINQDEAKYVKKIFDQYLKGMSMKKISNELNSKNIPTKQNKKWGPQTVSLILKNPIYCGFLHWEDYLNPSNHDPIINNKIFNEVQKLIKNRNLKTKHNSKIFIIPD